MRKRPNTKDGLTNRAGPNVIKTSRGSSAILGQTCEAPVVAHVAAHISVAIWHWTTEPRLMEDYDD